MSIDITSISTASLRDISFLDKDVDLDAEFYSNNSSLQHNLASEIIKNIKFRKDATVLDIGCGDGAITAEIAKLIPEGSILGIDSSLSMIKLAEEQYSSSNYSNLRFLLKDAEKFDYSEKFDFIVSFSCFHWIRNGKQTLKKLCNYLKPNGKMIILTYPSESIYYTFMQKALSEFPDYSSLSAYNTMLSLDEYKEVLNKCGMSLKEFSRKDLFTKSKNLQEIKDFIRGWLTSFVPLPKHLHDQYLNSIVKECKPYIQYDIENQIYLPYTELVLRAEKSK